MTHKKTNYHFLGIGGIGMSALAQILLERGAQVSGTDLVESPIIENLKKRGAKIFIGHKKENVTKAIDLLVVSAAINERNPEIIESRKLKIPIMNRGQLLGKLMGEKTGIAITGTHGKTTTSSLLASILENEGLDPTIVVGGEVRNIGGNAKDGKGKYFVAETCEYKRFFMDIFPNIAVITNIEADHLDYYKDLDDIVSAFSDFTKNIKNGGILVVCLDDINIKKALCNFEGKVISYGIVEQNLDFRAENLRTEEGVQKFSVFKGSNDLGDFGLSTPGIHNVLNSLAAIAVALECNVRLKTVKETLENFKGARRRMETKGKKDGVLVIDDYAHHPTEIQATLKAAHDLYPKQKVWCVFQPHQHSRTRILLNDFACSFDNAQEIIVPKIYPVRDTKEDIKSVSGDDLVTKVRKRGKSARYIPEFGDVVDFLNKNVSEKDIILTMGAGPVNEIGEMFLQNPSQLLRGHKF